MRRRRFRKWAKWACTAVAMMVLALTVASRWWMVSYGWRGSGGAPYHVGIGTGVVTYERNIAFEKRPTGWDLRASAGWQWGFVSAEIPGNQWRLGVYYYSSPGFGWALGVTLVYVAALASLPAALLWYADRRRFGPHACSECGYDRRGLAADAKCPECGTVPTK
jgi:hypothetical protein